MSTTTKTLYETDFVEWTAHTAEQLRAGRLDEAELEHAAEEIEGLGRSERWAVAAQLQRMLMHLIKQRIQPERDGASWRRSIADGRVEIRYKFDDSPSLRRARIRSKICSKQTDSSGQAILTAAAFEAASSRNGRGTLAAPFERRQKI